MTPIKPLPTDIDSQSSLKTYEGLCKDKAQKNGSTPDTFDLSKAMAENRAPGDGYFTIDFENPDKDFYCSALFNWETKEMMVDSGSVKAKKHIPLGAFYMDDACKITRQIFGEEELNGKVCIDGQDPKVSAISNSESFKTFLSYCGGKLDEHGKKFGTDLNDLLTLPRIQIYNEDKGDGAFDLRFMSGAYNFICDGRVNTLTNQMLLTNGLYSKKDQQMPEMDKIVELTDACTLTKNAVGEDELVGDCHDKTQGERNWETGIDLSWKGLMLGLAARDGYKLIKYGLRKGIGQTTLGYLVRGVRGAPGFIRSVPSLLARGGGAVARFFGVGGGAAADTAIATGGGAAADTAIATGGGAAVDTALATGGGAAVDTAIATGGGAAVDTALATGGAAAVDTAVVGGGAAAIDTAVVVGGGAAAVDTAAVVGGGTAAAVGGGGTAAAVGGGGAAAGAGATAGVALVGLAVGVGIGVGIEKGSQALFGAGPSDGIAWGLNKTFGPPSTSTIDFFDSIHVGSWYVFK